MASNEKAPPYRSDGDDEAQLGCIRSATDHDQLDNKSPDIPQGREPAKHRSAAGDAKPVLLPIGPEEVYILGKPENLAETEEIIDGIVDRIDDALAARIEAETAARDYLSDDKPKQSKEPPRSKPDASRFKFEWFDDITADADPEYLVDGLMPRSAMTGTAEMRQIILAL
jgi:hypothetical protein